MPEDGACCSSDLMGDTKLTFTDKVSTDVDVIFLCLGQAKQLSSLTRNPLPEKVKIIDLSQIFA
jgi:N-acetyl-gamma-glutamyl-phosphate reductase